MAKSPARAPSRLDSSSGLTRLLRAWGRGDAAARDELLPLVYDDLHARAEAYLRHERPNHTLQPTALVHEAYIRLVGQDRMAWRNRDQFFAVASGMMRRILVDHARARRAAKRPPDSLRLSVEEGAVGLAPVECEILLLDQALDDLAHRDARQAQIVEMRYFGGLSEQETARALSLSRTTVTREWQTARAWLYRRMTTGPSRPT